MAEALPELSAVSSSPDDSVIRILLMGRKSSGKSSTGNTILGQKKFKVHKQKKKQIGQDKLNQIYEEINNINEKQVHVIDTPDLLDPNLTKEIFEGLRDKLLSICATGLSAVLLVVPLLQDENKENEIEILDLIKYLLGPKVQSYLMVLFTYQDELEDDETIDDHLKDQDNAYLQQLVTECEGRFYCVSNKSAVVNQATDLLQKIEGIVIQNCGKFLMEQMKRRNSKEQPIVNFPGEGPADEGSLQQQNAQTKEPLRLVLLGKTGAGKSTTGNNILGRNVFESSSSSKSQTKKCSSESIERIGKMISVIDTPGLYDTELSEEELQTEIVKCIAYSSPGPHAFLIVIKVGRFTKEEKNTVEQLREVFGEQMEKYTIILFTHKDQLEKDITNTEEFIQDCDEYLQILIKNCGNRFVLMNNHSNSYSQFQGLLSKIETMVAENGGTHFINDTFETAGKYIEEMKQQNLNEKVKHYNEEQKAKTEWQKIYWRLAEESRREAEKSFSEACIAAIAQILKKVVVTPEEKESTIKEAESKGISRGEAVRLAIRATRKLAKQKMCGVQ